MTILTTSSRIAMYYFRGIFLFRRNMSEEMKSLYADVQPGMTVRVHQKIKDVNPRGEEKERVQVFEGRVIARKHGNGVNATITVRKVSNGVGVEKIFPVHLPAIVKIEKVKVMENRRRSKLYYLRDYKKKVKEKAL